MMNLSDEDDEDHTPAPTFHNVNETKEEQTTASTASTAPTAPTPPISKKNGKKRKYVPIVGYKYSLLTLNRNKLERVNIDIVDLFCSIGGYSTGAKQAGHRIALAVDNDEIALGVHKANNPETHHANLELGPETEEQLVCLIQKYVGDKPFHLHGSPPCTKLSAMQAALKGVRYQSDINEGMRLVYWFFDLVKRLKPKTWTFEQVAFSGIFEELSSLKRHRPVFFDFMKVQMADFGVPQTRTRVIGGTPHMIDRLRHASELRVSTHVSVKDTITPPEGTVYIRDSSYGRKTDHELTKKLPSGLYTNENAEKIVRFITEPSYTVMSSCSHTWLDIQFRTIRLINAQESLAIQTFPVNYLLPCNRKNQTRGIGNAIPCLFAQKLMSDYRL